jgi:hypothetical protein
MFDTPIEHFLCAYRLQLLRDKTPFPPVLPTGTPAQQPARSMLRARASL